LYVFGIQKPSTCFVFYSCRRTPAAASANLAILAASASSLPSMRTSKYAATAMGNPTLPTACRINSSGITPCLVSCGSRGTVLWKRGHGLEAGGREAGGRFFCFLFFASRETGGKFLCFPFFTSRETRTCSLVPFLASSETWGRFSCLLLGESRRQFSCFT
jgi:hypothetical protein